MAEKKKIGLVPRLLAGIVVGLLLGMVVPEFVIRVLATAGSIFGSYLSYLIPLMIVSFVASGIGHLTSGGAGKILLVTVVMVYCSTIVAGSFAYMVDSAIFPSFITPEIIENFKETSGVAVEPYLEFVLNPVFDVTTAIVLAFILGIGIIALRNGEEHCEVADLLLKIVDGIQAIIN